MTTNAAATSAPTGWLSGLQSAARAAYEAAPLPNRVAHLWRYTDPALFVPGGGGLAPAVDALVDAEAPDGVLVEELGERVRERGTEIRPLLGSLVPHGFGKFEALNAASWRRGTYVRVPRGAVLEAPIHLRAAAPLEGRAAPRLLAVIDEGAEATIVDEIIGGTPSAAHPAWVHGVAEIFVGPGARLRYLLVERSGAGVRHHATHRIRVGPGGSATTVIASVGGGVVKTDLGVLLEGEGAESETAGVAFGHGRQHVDQHTVLHHLAPRTRSRLDLKAVLKDRARSIYTGLIRIERSAPFSDAYQENRNLLLSEGARAESIPELEILVEEVACKHGATIGPIDEDTLFYLMSRGLPRADAIRIVVEGFIDPTLARLPEASAEVVRRILADRLKAL